MISANGRPKVAWTPELFNSENDSRSEEVTSIEKNEVEEDDLEIPAFLRRQKN